MTQEQEKLFEEKLKIELEKARTIGISIGAKSISGVIYDKVVTASRESSKNDLLRIIKDVRNFCETGLAIDKDNIK